MCVCVCVCVYIYIYYIKAVKLVEKQKKIFFTKILTKFELYSNLKGINSVKRKKKAKYYQMHISSKGWAI